MKYGVYLVTGRREYRGHKPGTRFTARLERNAEARAVQRRDIRLLAHVEPELPPDFTFPDGWLAGHPQPTTRGAERRLNR